MENQALTTQAQNSMQFQLEALGYGELTYLPPTKIELLQPTKAIQYGVRAGLFRSVDGLIESDVMRIVPLAIKPSRVLWDESGELGKTPICRSNDAIRPDPRPEYSQQAEMCATCQHANWDVYYKSGGKIKPSCSERWAFLFYDRDTSLVCLMNVGGTGVAALRELRTSLLKLVKMHMQKKGTPLNFFECAVTMKGTKTEGKKGTYYKLGFSELGKMETPDLSVQELAQMCQFYSYQGSASEDVEEAIEATAVEV